MKLRIAAILIIILAWISSATLAQDKPYAPKNGILNVKAILFGGGFRVNTAIPLHGNFAHYRILEIVEPESLIGKDVPGGFLEKLGSELKSEFEKGGRFTEVRSIGTFDTGTGVAPGVSLKEDFREADPMDSPMRNPRDMALFDRQREDADQPDAAAAAPGVLVIRCQVVDYARGNKILQLSMLDIGNSILTLRFSYFDKQTGEELGRSVISSDNSSRIIPSALSTRTVLNGIAEGLVDQITRRKVAAER